MGFGDPCAPDGFQKSQLLNPACLNLLKAAVRILLSHPSCVSSVQVSPCVLAHVLAHSSVNCTRLLILMPQKCISLCIVKKLNSVYWRCHGLNFFFIFIRTEELKMVEKKERNQTRH